MQVVGHRVGHWLSLWGQKRALADRGSGVGYCSGYDETFCSLALCMCNWPSLFGLGNFCEQAIFEAKAKFSFSVSIDRSVNYS